MLRLELLPGGPGDCIWLEYGEPGNKHNILIDGGIKKTSARLKSHIKEKLQECGGTCLHLELIIVTHIDKDHIDGILELLKDTKNNLCIGDIWFNGNKQLKKLPKPSTKHGDILGNNNFPSPDILGLVEGDQLSKLLSCRNLPWNKNSKVRLQWFLLVVYCHCGS